MDGRGGGLWNGLSVAKGRTTLAESSPQQLSPLNIGQGALCDQISTGVKSAFDRQWLGRIDYGIKAI